MKILLSSRHFYPSIGGSETNAEILAHAFTYLNHEVKIITQTTGTNKDGNDSLFPFEVIRQPPPLKFLKLVHWCDVYLHNGIMLREAWPLLIIRKPWIIRHQVWLRSMDGTLGKIGGTEKHWKVRLKHFATRFATSISISQTIADHLHGPSTVIPNPYRDQLFRVLPHVKRDKELIYVGRLVSEKGVNILLEAIADLTKQGIEPTLTVVGGGPEEAALKQKATELGIGEQVDFLGVKTGECLVELLNQHQIMVIPSLYDEPFGVVALEGIACGCVIVGSEGGGLKGAIGACGLTFPNKDSTALANILAELLNNSSKLATFRKHASVHLAQHTSTAVAQAYLEVFERVLQCS